VRTFAREGSAFTPGRPIFYAEANAARGAARKMSRSIPTDAGTICRLQGSWSLDKSRSAVAQMPQECDVLVVGGGPAGSTIAALLAQKGKHVVVLEKDLFPRSHIGESLLPLNLPMFDRLGVAEDVRRIGVYKPGAQVVSDEHGRETTFRFTDNPRLSVNHSYHVRRTEFDQLLLDNCRRLGATVIEGARVMTVDFGPQNRTSVAASGPDGSPVVWYPRFVVDASGSDTLLANRLGLKRVDKRNNTAAIFGHFRNVPRQAGDMEGMISMHLVEHGWFWMIPLPDGVMSVGLVGNQTFFKARTGDLGSLFAGAISASPSVADRMASAEPISPLTATANYSYDSRRATGEGLHPGWRCLCLHRSAVFERRHDGDEQRRVWCRSGRRLARRQEARREVAAEL
jgi:hypothetical protein